MSNPFERHGIHHLSPSSLQTYSNEPALWVLRYLYAVRDNAGPGAWRGSAVEAGVKLILYGTPEDEAIKAALAQFDAEAMGEVSERITKERGVIADSIKRAIEPLAWWGKPAATQFKVELWLDGIEVPIIGFVDFLWPELLVDLKSTLQCPSEPKPDHAAQVATYQLACGRDPYLLYVTPKKHALFGPEEIDLEQARWTLKQRAFALRNMLSHTINKEHAASLFAPNFDSYLWSATTKAAAMNVYGG